jgi:hypothetical protein
MSRNKRRRPSATRPATIPEKPMSPTDQQEIVAQEGAGDQGEAPYVLVDPGNWTIPSIDERHRMKGGGAVPDRDELIDNLPGALPPPPPQQYRPGPAEVRCALSAVFARLTVEQATLGGLASSMDLTAHPRAGEILQALLLTDRHLSNTWQALGSAIAGLRW